MPRSRLGSILELSDESIWARVRYTDRDGRRRERRRLAKSRTDARNKIKELIKEIERDCDGAVDAARMTFAQLADHFEKTYLVAPQYRDDSKISGLRAYKNFRYILQAARDHFGEQKIKTITYDDVKRFRHTRLETPVRPKTKGERDRSISTVNRELSLLRRVLRVAKRNGWIPMNPFDAGEPLIRPADEKHRDRILSYAEEDRLLAVCEGKTAHLRPILICALDTGMRRGEIITLTWRDIDLDERTITVQALNTKTIRRREVPMTDRLHDELNRLWSESAQKPELRVFGIENHFRRAFRTACRNARVKNLRFHDCRHTAATRLIQGGMSLQEVGRVLGHTQAQTTFRYVNVDQSAIRRAAEIFNQTHRRRQEEASLAAPS